MSTILVVDDNSLVLRVLKNALEKAGHSVASAGSVQEAMEQFANSGVEIVVTDEHMEGAHGTDLLRWLREEHPSVRTLLISGELNHELTLRAQQLGVGHILPKPFTPDELTRAVAGLNPKGSA